ncbi:hypothetical protein ACEPAH_2204 [Sanghuangporus vaninii]
MQIYISLVAVLVTLITENTFASPTVDHSTSTNATRASIEKRTPGGVFICTDLNWGGTCGYAVQPLDECILLGSDWDKQISSFGPDPCTICFGVSFSFQLMKKPLNEAIVNFGLSSIPVCRDAFEMINPLSCSLSESDCDEAEWEFTNPGDATGGFGTSDPWNDQISAFLCEQTC